QAAMVGAVDESLGRIREALTKQGLADNTMLLFLGDQGSLLSNKPLRGGKQGGTALYEGGARIPFVIHWPGVVAPGSISEPVLTTDVFPTILEAAGGRVSNRSDLDGESLIPLLRSKGRLDRNEIVLYRSYEDQYASIRSGKWKMIAYRSGKMELFDLAKDLSEERELSAKYPEKVNDLKARLYSWETKMGVEEISGCLK
ncbi:sulfatase-like hydrolase/transferase, partial [Candidatus Pacearchaeota archaeon]|nr:sulfatase-like hydrolase/transferase [Candidatus Pacearchaeota archaeon]